MGSCISKAKAKRDKLKYALINDNYTTYLQLENALRKAGLEASELIIGVDFTKSNKTNRLDKGNLHSTKHPPNPYQKVFDIVTRALKGFDTDQIIPAYGFGDSNTTNKSVFSFLNNEGKDIPCEKLDGVLEAYNGLIQQSCRECCN